MRCRTIAAVACTTGILIAGAGCHRADERQKLIAIIVPSQDNPYFKAEADAAAARAQALGYRVRVDAPSVPVASISRSKGNSGASSGGSPNRCDRWGGTCIGPFD